MPSSLCGAGAMITALAPLDTLLAGPLCPARHSRPQRWLLSSDWSQARLFAALQTVKGWMLTRAAAFHVRPFAVHAPYESFLSLLMPMKRMDRQWTVSLTWKVHLLMSTPVSL